MRRVCVILLALALAGCALAKQRELKEKMAALRQQSADAMKDCNERLPPGNPKIAVSRAQCVNAAFAILQPTMPYPDLLQTFMAEHTAIAEQVQMGKMTIVQGNAAIAEKWSAVVSEEQRRQLATLGVAAQVQSAEAASSAAAASWRAAGPRTCNYGGGTVTCF